MTQTQHQTEPASQLHPSDILMHRIVTLLTPMFLSASGGDVGLAHLAALETVNAYRGNNQPDLIAIAQIIAFGLAAIGSLSLSLADDVSLPMTLRLRGNANALHRSAEQNRRTLRQSHPAAQPEAAPTRTPDPAVHQTARPPAAHTNPPAPAVAPAPPLANTAPADAVRLRQARWASAMTDIAREHTTGLDHLAPAERKVASMRAAVLSTCASHLLLGTMPRAFGTVPDFRATSGNTSAQ